MLGKFCDLPYVWDNFAWVIIMGAVLGSISMIILIFALISVLRKDSTE